MAQMKYRAYTGRPAVLHGRVENSPRRPRPDPLNQKIGWHAELETHPYVPNELGCQSQIAGSNSQPLEWF